VPTEELAANGAGVKDHQLNALLKNRLILIIKIIMMPQSLLANKLKMIKNVVMKLQML